MLHVAPLLPASCALPRVSPLPFASSPVYATAKCAPSATPRASATRATLRASCVLERMTRACGEREARRHRWVTGAEGSAGLSHRAAAVQAACVRGSGLFSTRLVGVEHVLARLDAHVLEVQAACVLGVRDVAQLLPCDALVVGKSVRRTMRAEKESAKRKTSAA